MSEDKLKTLNDLLKSLYETRDNTIKRIEETELEKKELETKIAGEKDGTNKKKTRYLKNIPNDILPENGIFFGYKWERTMKIRWSISKKTTCMLIEFETDPGDDLIAKVKQAGYNFDILPATQTISERDALEKEKREKAIKQVRLIYPNDSGFCSVCGYNNGKYVNYIRGFATCCPNDGSKCLEQLGEAFKKAGCAFYGDGHDNCDKKYW